ncbi:MAG: phosphate transporter [Nitrospirales bacterium]|nr:MAG: phosphate transporter [Nitrospirales bacterium]
MESILTLLVILLLGIALFDLVVGVSNDAVNFLTSAIGSRAATFRTIMVVASIGVFVGAASSGGLMEIAKRGIFNPNFFTFQDIIFIYVVVMLTDVFLLDFFNSMRMPTSTTISIVFELLGASVAMSFLHVLDMNQPVSMWMDYLNTGKALEMITAIFVSVAIAFVVGWVVQYVLRGLLTFEYRRYGRIGGALFGGVAVVIVLNFIVNVGLKDSPLQGSVMVQFVIESATTVYVVAFAGATALFFGLGARKNYDAFRTVTLIGTFALAMAFASNDLVNFIGVPIAGFEALGYWSDSGVPADQYMMDVWAGPAGAGTATPIFLFIAGVVMVITLWVSKKARNVIQTEIDLGRQEEGVERFRGNEIARIFVRFVSFSVSQSLKLVPLSIRQAINRRYAARPVAITESPDDPPAFDLVRASTNLTIAAALISMGTYLKLPLSTTYVTFMLAMGTSLADRAWSQDSAVYRVSGVITVIAGWFLTAIAALSLSAVFALIVGTYGFVGIGIVILLVALGLYTVNRLINTELRLAASLDLPEAWFDMSPEELQPLLRRKTAEIAAAYSTGIDQLETAVVNRDRRIVRELKARLNRQIEKNTQNRGAVTRNIKQRATHENVEAAKALLFYFVEETELLHNVRIAAEVVRLHVLNLHRQLDPDQQSLLEAYFDTVRRYLELAADEHSSADEICLQLMEIEGRADAILSRQISGNVDNLYTHKNNELVVSTIIRHSHASRNISRMLGVFEGHLDRKKGQSSGHV